jgi:hypothetical protein
MLASSLIKSLVSLLLWVVKELLLCWARVDFPLLLLPHSFQFRIKIKILKMDKMAGVQVEDQKNHVTVTAMIERD